MSYAFKLEPDRKVRLSDYQADFHGGLSKDEAIEQYRKLNVELQELQELLSGAGLNSVLLVLQGRDTSGKDGTIKSVFDNINPQGCKIAGFKVPTDLERAHDFLWRVHKEAPARGQIGIFNRSHYEDVLVVRVHKLLEESIWKERYRQINDFERLLHETGTIIVKCYLHISEGEQQKRLLAREADPIKAWKLSLGDWQERQLWDDYTRAYEDALERCNQKNALWHVVPADYKWFRNLAVTELLVKAMRPYREAWIQELTERGKEARKEIEAYRSSLKSP